MVGVGRTAKYSDEELPEGQRHSGNGREGHDAGRRSCESSQAENASPILVAHSPQRCRSVLAGWAASVPAGHLGAVGEAELGEDVLHVCREFAGEGDGRGPVIDFEAFDEFHGTTSP